MTLSQGNNSDNEVNSKLLTPQDERRIITDLKSTAELWREEGDTYYIVSAKWWKEWEDYVGINKAIESKRPEEIDNSSLVLNDMAHELRDGLLEGLDYVVLHQNTFSQLHDWYGGGPIFKRKLLSLGPSEEDFMVEVYPFRLLLTVQSDKEITVTISKQTTVDKLYKRVRKLLKLDPQAKIQIFDYFGKQNRRLIDELGQTLEEAGLQMDQDILLNVEDGIDPVDSVSEKYFNGTAEYTSLGASNEPFRFGSSIAGGPSAVKEDTSCLLPLQTLDESLTRSFAVSKNLTLEIPYADEVPENYYDPARKKTRSSHSSSRSDNSSAGGSLDVNKLSISTESPSWLVPNDEWMNGDLTPGEPNSLEALENLYSENDNSTKSFRISLRKPWRDSIGDDSDSKGEIGGNTAGLTGLPNIGNSCYMASALQCLVHTNELVKFFHGDYSDQINMQNPFGTKGDLALGFGEFLKALWVPGRKTFPLNKFKKALGKLDSAYAGRSQEDSQELLLRVLDALHEDLNRVVVRRQTEKGDWNGRPDEEVANEHWEFHKANNDSLITDLFYGQFREDKLCVVCLNRISSSFDPFVFLELPLSSTSTRTLTVTVFDSEGTEPRKTYTIEVPASGVLQDVDDALVSACSLRDDAAFLLAELWGDEIRYLEEPDDSISEIEDHTRLAAYRVPGAMPLLVLIPVRKETGEPFCAPIISSLNIEEIHNGADLHVAVQDLLASILRKKKGLDHHHQNPDVIMEDASSKDEEIPSFCIWLTDEKGSTKDTIEKEKPIWINLDSNTKVHILIEWTEADLEQYDLTYLADELEVVSKPKSAGKRNRGEERQLDLYSCLDAELLQGHLLDPNTLMYCPHCKKEQRFMIKTKLWKSPEILIIHLKRFQAVQYSLEKIDDIVDYPLNLDLGKFVVDHESNASQNHMYELYAVVNHYGSINFGHYVANAKVNDKWYKFNDEKVTRCQGPEKNGSYVLFYRKVKSETTSMSIDSKF